MKKLLLVSTAIAGVALLSAPASAAVKLDLGGYFRGYGVYADNDETVSTRKYDLRRDTEVHVSGETTLDNGLTVGFHTEQALGGATMTDEAYAYFSGGWGRVNVGSEDGAAYLLQVAAPSADSNVDGLRNYIQAMNPTSDTVGIFAAGALGLPSSTQVDYDLVSDATGAHNTDRLTYLTPKFSGFQAGVSYATETGQNAVGNNLQPMNTDEDDGDYEHVWDLAARWDGEFQGFGIGAGAGWGRSALEHYTLVALGASPVAAGSVVTNDDITQWDAGLNVSYMGFSLGGAYLRADSGQSGVIDTGGGVVSDARVQMDTDKITWVAGLGYDNGPYHLGGSYLRTKFERDGAGDTTLAQGGYSAVDAHITRYTVGGGYTFGPGMTFRGAVAWGEYQNETANATGASSGSFDTASQNDFKQVTLGTDIQF